MARIRIGLSGWDYAGWQGDFYPDSLPASKRLSYVGERFDTVEVNGTFYSLLKPDTFRKWNESVPSGFVFAVKGSRFITHNKKLSNVETALANFFASGVLDLDEKLGPILWQVSGGFHFHPDRVESFFDLLPRDTNGARKLARRHDDRVDDVSYGPDVNHRIRHVFEIRHESYLCSEMVRIARRNSVALAFSHSREWPYTEEITAGFVYVRLHGPGLLYGSAYGEDALAKWGDRILAWNKANEPEDPERITGRVPPPRKERDVYVYFDNDEGGHAPREAVFLRHRLAEHL